MLWLGGVGGGWPKMPRTKSTKFTKEEEGSEGVSTRRMMAATAEEHVSEIYIDLPVSEFWSPLFAIERIGREFLLHGR